MTQTKNVGSWQSFMSLHIKLLDIDHPLTFEHSKLRQIEAHALIYLSNQNFMQKKDDKVGNKTGYKKKGKGKKKTARKNIEIDSQKKKEIWLMRMPEKQQSRLITSS